MIVLGCLGKIDWCRDHLVPMVISAIALGIIKRFLVSIVAVVLGLGIWVLIFGFFGIVFSGYTPRSNRYDRYHRHRYDDWDDWDDWV